MLDTKLQLKPGQTVAITNSPMELGLKAAVAPVDQADAVLIFVTTQSELAAKVSELVKATGRQAVTWVMYPKAKQLGTDVNRDYIRNYVGAHNLETVRQIAIDDTWSALRLKHG